MISERERIETEDTLKHLHECEYEGGGRLATAESVAGAVGCSRDRAVVVLERLVAGGLGDLRADGVALSVRGREYARQVIRAHRLYETYLARRTGTPAGDWHGQADKAEHGLVGGPQADELAGSLGHPRFDPHGDPIPTRVGTLPELRGGSLLSIGPEALVRVLHVGDEPEAVGRRLAKLGIAPGAVLRVRRADGRGVQASIEGRVVDLSSAEAANVRVERTSEASTVSDAGVIPLSHLAEGESAEICGLAAACRGAERSRLLDLGFVRGSEVQADMVSPLGSPMAYRVRGALVALRSSQAEAVLVKRRERDKGK